MRVIDNARGRTVGKRCSALLVQLLTASRQLDSGSLWLRRHIVAEFRKPVLREPEVICDEVVAPSMIVSIYVSAIVCHRSALFAHLGVPTVR